MTTSTELASIPVDSNEQEQRTTQCRDCPLRKLACFDPAGPDQTDYVSKFKTGEFNAQAKTTIFEEESNPPHVYTVLRGIGITLRTTPEGGRQILSIALPGDLIGLQTVLDGNIDHSFEALTDMTLCVFDRTSFLQLFNQHTQLAYDVVWLAARRESILQNHLVAIGTRTALGRIAWVLLYLEHHFDQLGVPINDGLPIPLNQSHFADLLGLSLVHTNKTFAKMRKAELISINNDRIDIIDRDQLISESNFDSDSPALLRRPLL